MTSGELLRRRSVLLGRGFFALALAVGLCPAIAEAQSTGDWWARPRPIERQPAQHPFEGRDAAQLYADARADIEHGNLAFAQRRLDWLLHRFPDSPLAAVARNDLQSVKDHLASRRETGRDSAARAHVETAQPLSALPGPIAVNPASETSPGYPGARRPAARDSGRNAAEADTGLTAQFADDFRTEAGDRVFFGEGSSDLGARARAALEAQARWLVKHPNVRVRIDGHADDRGNRDQNVQLSEQRADAVKQRLVEAGVTPGRVTIHGHGRDQPVAQCADPACGSQNRRVVTTIVGATSLSANPAGERGTLAATSSSRR